MIKQLHTELVRNEKLNPDTVLQTYRCPDVAGAALPGQFVNIRVSEHTDPLLRRPLSICGVDRNAGTFTALIKIVGQGTQLLGELAPGAKIDLIGPLGRPFDWTGARRMLLVAGGVGVAPLHFLASEVHATAPDPKPEIVFCYGARTAGDFVLLDQIETLVDRLVLVTEDGSRGEKGLATEAAEKQFTPETSVFTCGPNPMMNDLLRRMRAAGLEGQVSLENQMGCGIGACQGCVVPTRSGYLRVCHDGPVMRTELFDKIEF